MARYFDISLLQEISGYWGHPEPIKQHIRNLERDIPADLESCIDHAKCLLEAICKTVLEEHHEEYQDDKKHLNKLFSKCLQKLRAYDQLPEEIAKEVFNASVKLVEQIARYRNEFSIASHGRAASHKKLPAELCLMAVGTLLSSCHLVFESHKNAKGDVYHTLRPYESFKDYNDFIDANSLIGVDQDENIVLINRQYSFLPSQILFALDRQAYKDAISDYIAPTASQEGAQK